MAVIIVELAAAGLGWFMITGGEFIESAVAVCGYMYLSGVLIEGQG